MQSLWLGYGSDPTLRLHSLIDSIFEQYENHQGDFMHFVKVIGTLCKVLEKQVDRVS